MKLRVKNVATCWIHRLFPFRYANLVCMILIGWLGVHIAYSDHSNYRECLACCFLTLAQLLDDENGNIHIHGLAKVEVVDANDLLSLLEKTADQRKTHETFVNSVSSRTHSFIELELSTDAGEGKLVLVDLAGSERNKDSSHHDAARQKESAHINSSLMALKECIRKRNERAGYVPFRMSELTRLLKPAFTREQSVSAVIATISPGATDCEHSLNTLNHASLMSGAEEEPVTTIFDIGLCFQEQGLPEERKNQLKAAPIKWSKDEVAAWVKEIDPLCRVPYGTDGKQLIRFSKARFVQACSGDEVRGKFIFDTLRSVIEMRKQEEATIRAEARQESRAKQLMSVKSMSEAQKADVMRSENNEGKPKPAKMSFSSNGVERVKTLQDDLKRLLSK